mmetsp:Transcript_14564/g.35519  ORF Transcript_14564/g.35519 Transcript_14564/m.35519 type:complete len:248 (-) Transcript_14564:2581-3324(-)
MARLRRRRRKSERRVCIPQMESGVSGRNRGRKNVQENDRSRRSRRATWNRAARPSERSLWSLTAMQLMAATEPIRGRNNRPGIARRGLKGEAMAARKTPQARGHGLASSSARRCPAMPFHPQLRRASPKAFLRETSRTRASTTTPVSLRGGTKRARAGIKRRMGTTSRRGNTSSSSTLSRGRPWSASRAATTSSLLLTRAQARPPSQSMPSRWPRERTAGRCTRRQSKPCRTKSTRSSKRSSGTSGC